MKQQSHEQHKQYLDIMYVVILYWHFKSISWKQVKNFPAVCLILLYNFMSANCRIEEASDTHSAAIKITSRIFTAEEKKNAWEIVSAVIKCTSSFIPSLDNQHIKFYVQINRQRLRIFCYCTEYTKMQSVSSLFGTVVVPIMLYLSHTLCKELCYLYIIDIYNQPFFQSKRSCSQLLPLIPVLY